MIYDPFYDLFFDYSHMLIKKSAFLSVSDCIMASNVLQSLKLQPLPPSLFNSQQNRYWLFSPPLASIPTLVWEDPCFIRNVLLTYNLSTKRSKKEWSFILSVWGKLYQQPLDSLGSNFYRKLNLIVLSYLVVDWNKTSTVRKAELLITLTDLL